MKLRNKKTGEIEEFVLFDGNGLRGGATLESLTKEWEDAPEEPKEYYWVIDDDGMLVCRTVGDFANEERCKHIGNYFETKEEAEKAVEKLKAWKRLKDKGFRFDGWKCTGSISFTFDNYCGDGQLISASDDLDLIFGGEE